METLTGSEKNAAWLKRELDKVVHILLTARLDATNCLVLLRKAEASCDSLHPQKSVELTRLKYKIIEVMQDFDKGGIVVISPSAAIVAASIDVPDAQILFIETESALLFADDFERHTLPHFRRGVVCERFHFSLCAVASPANFSKRFRIR